MGTSSNRSAGTQVTQRGIVQGVSLVDPETGNPVAVIIDNSGVERLAVDADITVDNIPLDLNPVDSTVSIGNKNGNGYTLAINSDGSIDANVLLNYNQDSVAIGDPSSGNELKINSDGSINVDIPEIVASTPVIYNISVPSANTEVSQTLPNNTKQFVIRVRNDSSRLQLGFSSGSSGTNYITVNRGTSFSQDNLDTSLTLYFQTNQSNQIIEILAWS